MMKHFLFLLLIGFSVPATAGDSLPGIEVGAGEYILAGSGFHVLDTEKEGQFAKLDGFKKVMGNDHLRHMFGTYVHSDLHINTLTINGDKATVQACNADMCLAPATVSLSDVVNGNTPQAFGTSEVEIYGLLRSYYDYVKNIVPTDKPAAGNTGTQFFTRFGADFSKVLACVQDLQGIEGVSPVFTNMQTVDSVYPESLSFRTKDHMYVMFSQNGASRVITYKIDDARDADDKKSNPSAPALIAGGKTPIFLEADGGIRKTASAESGMPGINLQLKGSFPKGDFAKNGFFPHLKTLIQRAAVKARDEPAKFDALFKDGGNCATATFGRLGKVVDKMYASRFDGEAEGRQVAGGAGNANPPAGGDGSTVNGG
jgi:hypothetical protein